MIAPLPSIFRAGRIRGKSQGIGGSSSTYYKNKTFPETLHLSLLLISVAETVSDRLHIAKESETFSTIEFFKSKFLLRKEGDQILDRQLMQSSCPRQIEYDFIKLIV